MYTPIYSAGGVYVPHTHTMYMPLRAGAAGFGGPTAATAIATTASGMLAYYPQPYQNVIAAAGGMPNSNFYANAYTAGMGSPSMSMSMSSGAGGDGPAQLRKLFIGGLNHETTDEQLKEYYSQWGQVVDCIVIRDPATKHSRGFGFVTYCHIHEAETAMAERPHTINGKVVDPKRAIPREQMLPMTANNPPYFLEIEPPTGCKLTLSGIHWDFHTVDDLRKYFEKFGDVEQVEIVGQPRGYGFVVYEERDAAEKCLATNRVHLINGRKIEIKECFTSANDLFGQQRKHNSQHQRSSSHQQSSSLASHESSNCTPESYSDQEQSGMSNLECSMDQVFNNNNSSQQQLFSSDGTDGTQMAQS